MRHIQFIALAPLLALLIPGLAHGQTSVNPTAHSSVKDFEASPTDFGASSGEWKSHEQEIEWVKALATPVGTVATLWIALFTLRAGNKNQFRLKALEVALNSSSSMQMKSKIKALRVNSSR